MGWVTLTLRKTELKRSHSDYQMELLQISRTKRQMARQYHYEQTVARHDGQEAVSDLYATYKSTRDQANNDMKAATTTDQDGNKTTDQAAYNQAQQALNAAKEDYEMQKMQAQNDMEEELERLEQEANDTETMLDQEQVEVEAQLEAISAEIEAVGSAISDQVQASTIKLA